jgi:predicted O-methyltransferase YrrM
MYLASACENGSVVTLEGEDSRIAIANSSIKRLGLNNVVFLQGNFQQTLPLALESVPKLDFVFFDGNHTKEATLNYFNLCLSKVHENSVFVFDDIRWNDEMYEAWNEIVENLSVTISIDLFKMGIVFFRKGIIKQHFNINY